MINNYLKNVEVICDKHFNGSRDTRKSILIHSYALLTGNDIPVRTVYAWLNGDVVTCTRFTAIHMERLSDLIHAAWSTAHDKICYQLFLDLLATRMWGRFGSAYQAERLLSDAKVTQACFLDIRTNTSYDDVAKAVMAFLSLLSFKDTDIAVVETAAVICDLFLMSAGVGEFFVTDDVSTSLRNLLELWQERTEDDDRKIISDKFIGLVKDTCILKL